MTMNLEVKPRCECNLPSVKASLGSHDKVLVACEKVLKADKAVAPSGTSEVDVLARLIRVLWKEKKRGIQEIISRREAQEVCRKDRSYCHLISQEVVNAIWENCRSDATENGVYDDEVANTAFSERIKKMGGSELRLDNSGTLYDLLRKQGWTIVRHPEEHDDCDNPGPHNDDFVFFWPLDNAVKEEEGKKE